MQRDIRSWAPVALIWLATLLAYSNSFWCGFVLDSQPRILENPRITAVTAENLGLILTESYSYPEENDGNYRPVTTLSYLFNYAVLGDERNPFGYHAVNLALHFLNIALLYRLAFLIFGRIAPAASVAALWALHPVQTEAVTNMVGRCDLLAAAAVLGSLLCHIQLTQASGRRRTFWLAAMMLLFTFGLFAKENAAILPAILLIWDLAFPRPGAWRARILSYLALVPPLLAFALVRARVFAALPALKIQLVANPLLGAGLLTSRLTAIKVIGEYLRLLVWPARLSCDYSFNQIPLSGFGDWKALLALAVCILLAAACIFSYRRSKPAFFFLAFFFAALLPTSNLILRIGTIMGERLLYLPSVGFAGCLVALLYRTAHRTAPAAVALALMLIALGARTYARNRDWTDEPALSSSAVIAAPDSFANHWRLALALEEQDPTANLDAAIHQVDEATAILDRLPDTSDIAPPYVTAGQLYREKGDLAGSSSADASTWYRAALGALEHAVRIDRVSREQYRKVELERGRPASRVLPTGWEPAYLQLGITWLRLGEPRKALDAMLYGRILNPTDAALYHNIALAYRQTGDARQPGMLLLEGWILKPDDPGIQSDLAQAELPVNADPRPPELQRQICEAHRNLLRMLSENNWREQANYVRETIGKRLGCPNP